LKAKAGETIPKAGAETRDTDRKVRARSQRFQLDGIARGTAQEQARGESRTPERESARGLAGRRQEMKGASLESSAGRKAAGGLSGGEGRKPGAETQPEGKVGGSAARQS